MIQRMCFCWRVLGLNRICILAREFLDISVSGFVFACESVYGLCWSVFIPVLDQPLTGDIIDTIRHGQAYLVVLV